MNWRFVLDTKKILTAGSHKAEAKNLAQHAGYQFFLFNGSVFFVNKLGESEKTEITVNDLY